MEEKVVKILNEMSEYLSIAQMKKLQEVMLKVCAENEADKVEKMCIRDSSEPEMFLIEKCSSPIGDGNDISLSIKVFFTY